LRNYWIALVVFTSIAISLPLDADATLTFQNLLGVCAWVFLFAFLRGASHLVRPHVLLAVAFASAGAHFASLYLDGLIYRLHTVPAYIPPGPGLVYLTAVALARSGFFERNIKAIKGAVFIAGGGWSIWGLTNAITGAPHGDAVGALLFVV